MSTVTAANIGLTAQTNVYLVGVNDENLLEISDFGVSTVDVDTSYTIFANLNLSLLNPSNPALVLNTDGSNVNVLVNQAKFESSITVCLNNVLIYGLIDNCGEELGGDNYGEFSASTYVTGLFGDAGTDSWKTGYNQNYPYSLAGTTDVTKSNMVSSALSNTWSVNASVVAANPNLIADLFDFCDSSTPFQDGDAIAVVCNVNMTGDGDTTTFTYTVEPVDQTVSGASGAEVTDVFSHGDGSPKTIEYT